MMQITTFNEFNKDRLYKEQEMKFRSNKSELGTKYRNKRTMTHLFLL